MKEKLYHVSNIGGLKVLQPRVSTHGVPYVYATKNLPLALLFGSGASNGDLDGSYGVKKDGQVYFYEAFEGSFKNRFKNQSCYIYEVDPTDFMEDKTSFKPELVSEKPVKVVSEIKVEDLYDHLIGLSKGDDFILKEYSFEPDYVELMNKHIMNRIFMFGIYKNPKSTGYAFCEKHFPELLKRAIACKTETEPTKK